MNLEKVTRKSGKTVWRIRWREGGKNRSKVLKGVSTERQAKLAFANILTEAEARAAGRPYNTRVTLAEAMDDLIDAKRGAVSESRLKELAWHRDRLAQYFGDNRYLNTITPSDAHEFAERMAQEGLTPKTINGFLQTLKLAAREAEPKTGPSQLERLKFLRDTRPRTWRRVPDADIRALLDTATGDFLTFLLFAVHTGARLSEILAVDWDDLDLKVQTVQITSTKSVRAGGRAKTRTIPLPDRLAEHLKWKRGLKHERLLPRRNNLHRRWKQTLAKAGVTYHRIHDLRHTFASTLADAGTPPYVLKELMGHASLDTTMMYYHAGGEATRSAIDNLGDHFAAPRETGAQPVGLRKKR